MAKTGDIVVSVVLGGLIAGTVDIGAAALINAKGPDFIARIIAGGLFGRDALKGGLAMTCAGVVTQWVLSMIIAAIWVFASLALPALRRWWWAAGALFGLPVFAVMEFVVVPMSALHGHPKFTGVMAKDLSLYENLVAMVVFGLIAAGITRWRLGPGRQTTV